MSQLQRFREPNKPSAASIMAIRRPRRSLTEQQSNDSSQGNFSTERQNAPSSKTQNFNDFPFLYAQHKRNQYSGYKQLTSGKGKTIKFNQITHDCHREQTPQTFEIGSKNIAKLRKRFSLDPIQVKEYRIEQQKMFMATSKSLQKERQMKSEKSHTERQYHRELREMLRLMNLHHRTSSGKIISQGVKTCNSSEETPQNLSHANSQSPDDKCDDLSAVGERIQQLPQQTMGFNKPYYVQIKKRVERNIHNITKKKILPSIGKLMHKDQQQTLCGWTAKSFYPKNRSHFLDDFNEEKTRLVEGEI